MGEVDLGRTIEKFFLSHVPPDKIENQIISFDLKNVKAALFERDTKGLSHEQIAHKIHNHFLDSVRIMTRSFGDNVSEDFQTFNWGLSLITDLGLTPDKIELLFSCYSTCRNRRLSQDDFETLLMKHSDFRDLRDRILRKNKMLDLRASFHLYAVRKKGERTSINKRAFSVILQVNNLELDIDFTALIRDLRKSDHFSNYVEGLLLDDPLLKGRKAFKEHLQQKKKLQKLRSNLAQFKPADGFEGWLGEGGEGEGEDGNRAKSRKGFSKEEEDFSDAHLGEAAKRISAQIELGEELAKQQRENHLKRLRAEEDRKREEAEIQKEMLARIQKITAQREEARRREGECGMMGCEDREAQVLRFLPDPSLHPSLLSPDLQDQRGVTIKEESEQERVLREIQEKLQRHKEAKRQAKEQAKKETLSMVSDKLGEYRAKGHLNKYLLSFPVKTPAPTLAPLSLPPPLPSIPSHPFPPLTDPSPSTHDPSSSPSPSLSPIPSSRSKLRRTLEQAQNHDRTLSPRPSSPSLIPDPLPDPNPDPLPTITNNNNNSEGEKSVSFSLPVEGEKGEEIEAEGRDGGGDGRGGKDDKKRGKRNKHRPSPSPSLSPGHRPSRPRPAGSHSHPLPPLSNPSLSVSLSCSESSSGGEQSAGEGGGGGEGMGEDDPLFPPTYFINPFSFLNASSEGVKSEHHPSHHKGEEEDDESEGERAGKYNYYTPSSFQPSKLKSEKQREEERERWRVRERERGKERERRRAEEQEREREKERQREREREMEREREEAEEERRRTERERERVKKEEEDKKRKEEQEEKERARLEGEEKERLVKEREKQRKIERAKEEAEKRRLREEKRQQELEEMRREREEAVRLEREKDEKEREERERVRLEELERDRKRKEEEEERKRIEGQRRVEEEETRRKEEERLEKEREEERERVRIEKEMKRRDEVERRRREIEEMKRIKEEERKKREEEEKRKIETNHLDKERAEKGKESDKGKENEKEKGTEKEKERSSSILFPPQPQLVPDNQPGEDNRTIRNSEKGNETKSPSDNPLPTPSIPPSSSSDPSLPSTQPPPSHSLPSLSLQLDLIPPPQSSVTSPPVTSPYVTPPPVTPLPVPVPSKESIPLSSRSDSEGDRDRDKDKDSSFISLASITSLAETLTFRVPRTEGELRVFIRHDDEGEVHGLFVHGFKPNSLAERQGLLRVGDELLAVNGVDVRGKYLADVISALSVTNTLDYAELEIRRLFFTERVFTPYSSHSDELLVSARSWPEDLSDELDSSALYQTVSVVASKPSHVPYLSDLSLASSFLDLDLAVPKTEGELRVLLRHDDEGEVHGLFVHGFKPNSLAERQGLLRVGDELLAVNGVDVRGKYLADVVPALQSRVDSEEVSLRVRRYNLDHPARSPRLVSARSAVSRDRAHLDPSSSPTPFNEASSVSSILGFFTDLMARSQKDSEGLIHSPPFRVLDSDFRKPSNGLELADLLSLPSEQIEILVPKTNGELRVHIRHEAEGDSVGLFVHGFKPDSEAEKQGSLRIGDQILAVNGHSVIGLGLVDLVPFIQLSSETPSVRMLVRRLLMSDEASTPFSARSWPEDLSLKLHQSPLYRSVSVVASKPSHVPYLSDLSLASSFLDLDLAVPKTEGELRVLLRHDDEGEVHGLFVHGFKPNSLAERQGLLRVGDELLAVNGVDVRGKYLADVVPALQSRADSEEVSLRVRRYNLDHPARSPRLVSARAAESLPSPKPPSHSLNSFLSSYHSQSSLESASLSQAPLFQIQDSAVRKPSAGPSLSTLLSLPSDTLSIQVPRTEGELRVLLRHDDEGEVHGLFVHGFKPNSLAERQGLLRVGDELLAVNGVDVRGKYLADVVPALGLTSDSSFVDLIVRRLHLLQSPRGQ